MDRALILPTWLIPSVGKRLALADIPMNPDRDTAVLPQ